MKWNKFAKILDTNPWLRSHVGTPHIVSLPLNVSAEKARRALKEYVRKHVDYIAFRPFDKLDLNLHPVVEITRLPNSEYKHVTFAREKVSIITIDFHIEGVDKPFSRSRYVNTGSCIAEELRHLAEWYSSYWDKLGHAIKMGAVVTLHIENNTLTKFQRQHLEVYPFPENFNLMSF